MASANSRLCLKVQDKRKASRLARFYLHRHTCFALRNETSCVWWMSSRRPSLLGLAAPTCAVLHMCQLL